MKSAITELNLDVKNIVGKTFDGAANMNGVHKEGWRMVPRKTWVSENFGRISKSRKRF